MRMATLSASGQFRGSGIDESRVDAWVQSVDQEDIDLTSWITGWLGEKGRIVLRIRQALPFFVHFRRCSAVDGAISGIHLHFS